MTNTEKVNKMFSNGNSCLRSIFIPYSKEYGMNISESSKIISLPFAGTNTCGAVLGTLKAIGLKHEKTDCYEEKFIEKFEEIYGSCICLNIKSNSRKINKSCTSVVNDAALILEDIMK